VTARASVPQSKALLALLGAAVAGFLAGGALGLAREAPATKAVAAPAVQSAPRDGFGAALARALPRLNTGQLEQRVVLANSLTAREQATAAERLARVYADSARELERLGGRDGATGTVAALERISYAYERLAAAALPRDRAAYADAAGAVRTHERRLRAILRELNPN